ATRRVLQCRIELRRPAPGDERRVRPHGRGVRRPRSACAQYSRGVACAAPCSRRGRSPGRGQAFTPVKAPHWLIERPIAHRGLHDEAKGIIENTLAAAEAAIKNGFAIECDVQLSSDGETFVFHDRTLERLTNSSGALSVKTSAEIAKIQIK